MRHLICHPGPTAAILHVLGRLPHRSMAAATRLYAMRVLCRRTGNCGATKEYWYHRAVLVAWPKSVRLQVATQSGYPALLRLLNQTLRDPSWYPHEQQPQQPQQQLAQTIERLVAEAAAAQKHRVEAVTAVVRAISTALNNRTCILQGQDTYYGTYVASLS